MPELYDRASSLYAKPNPVLSIKVSVLAPRARSTQVLRVLGLGDPRRRGQRKSTSAEYLLQDTQGPGVLHEG